MREILNFIDDNWVEPVSGRWIDVEDPSTGEVFARVADSGPEDVDRAVTAARVAFEEGPWARTPPAERAAVLAKVADLLESRVPELVGALAQDTGTAAKLCGGLQVFGPVVNLRGFTELAEMLAEPQVHRQDAGEWRISRDPVGVIAGFVPYNFPMYEAVWKAAPALLAGNSIILKSPPTTPVGVVELARAFKEAGLPPGVLSVLHGDAETGQALVEHPGVDLVTFTGSTPVARRVMASAAGRLTPVVMELGGKSPAVVLADADLDLAVRGTVFSSMLHAGQTCVATSRLLVPQELYEEAVALAVRYTEQFVVGPALAEGTDMGPLNSAAQLRQVEAFVETGLKEGASLATGGERPEGLPQGGHYYRPTVLRDVKNDMTVAQEEIFGPVLCVIAYSSEDEAVRLANDSRFGLAASVWSRDEERAAQVARRLQVGLVWVNDAGAIDVARTPMAGRKQSGVGAELGPDGIYAYTLPKSTWFSSGTGEQAAPWGMLIHPGLGGAAAGA